MMKKFSLLFLMIIMLAGCASKENKSSNNPSITDDIGNRIELPGVPQKIISLAPNITEMIFKLGCGDKLIGNTTYCSYPEEARKVAKVGDLLSIDYEKILSLKPELIFVSVEGNKKEFYDKMVKLGIKVFVSNPRNFEGIKKTYRDVALILGKEKEAGIETAAWDEKIKSIAGSTKILEGKKVLYLIEIKPIMAAGVSTFLNEYIRLLNMKNVTEGVTINYPVLNREDLIRLNPDVIIYPDDGETTLESFKKSYPEWKNISAIKNEKIIFADRDLYFRPGPRFIDALMDLKSKL